MADPAVLDRRQVPVEEWARAVAEARDAAYTFFDWLTAVDETDAAEDPGFDIVCHLMDVSTPTRLRRMMIRTRVPEGAAVPSVTGIFKGAAWHERETHEMFGVEFTDPEGQPLGMEKLLLPEEFEGHPLRKDFVLAARVAKPWPGAKEPGESHAGGGRRQPMRPPGVPAPGEWGPRAAGRSDGNAAPGGGGER